MEKLSAARNAALKALYETEKSGAYLNAALRTVLAEERLSARDSALATQLAAGVERNRLYLDNIIKNLSSVKMKKISVHILNILRIGIYSIKFLDKIPVSATVNECVRLSRRYGHSASAGFVNAVLRKAAKTDDFLPPREAGEEYISVRYSCPPWLVQLWLSEGYGEPLFAAMNEVPPVYVRLNTLKASALGSGYEKSSSAPDAYIFTGSGSAENTEEYKNGLITVQDAASQRAVRMLAPKENSAVLDLCAAPGGKTTYMAQLMKNTGQLISCDIHPHKTELLKKNIERMGIVNARVMLNDASVFNPEFENGFDCVLADVPCSGLGILRRKPDIKWKKTPEELGGLVPLQRKIIDNAARYVKSGGRILISTCTVNKAENEENILYFLGKHGDFALVEQKLFLPDKDGTDGFFAALLERK